jgi:hypothetical protein
MGCRRLPPAPLRKLIRREEARVPAQMPVDRRRRDAGGLRRALYVRADRDRLHERKLGGVAEARVPASAVVDVAVARVAARAEHVRLAVEDDGDQDVQVGSQTWGAPSESPAARAPEAADPQATESTVDYAFPFSEEELASCEPPEVELREDPAP